MKFHSLALNATEKRRAFLLVAFVYYLYNLVFNWALIEWSGFRGESRFIDLHSVLKSAECFETNELGIYSDISHTACHGYMYGRELIFAIQALRIHPSQSFLLGNILAIVTLLTLLALLERSETSITILIVLSFAPGLSLLFERGNLDGFIALIVIGAAILYEQNSKNLSILLLMAASIFKFYTFPLVILIVLISKLSWKIKGLWLGISAVIAMDILLQIKSASKVPGTWFISFGAQIFGEYADLGFRFASRDFHLNTVSKIAIGMMFTLTSFAISKRILRLDGAVDTTYDPKNKEMKSNTVAIFSFVVFISCYLTGVSYDYRAIFYILAINGIFATKSRNTPLITILIMLSILCTTIFPNEFINLRVAFQFIGDLAMLLLIPFMFKFYLHKIQEMRK